MHRKIKIDKSPTVSSLSNNLAVIYGCVGSARAKTLAAEAVTRWPIYSSAGAGRLAHCVEPRSQQQQQRPHQPSCAKPIGTGFLSSNTVSPVGMRGVAAAKISCGGKIRRVQFSSKSALASHTDTLRPNKDSRTPKRGSASSATPNNARGGKTL